MTAARQREKRLLLLRFIAALVGSLPGHLSAEPVLVVNPASGLVISGFDPVAYFTDGRAEQGRPEIELSADGAVWRFRNPGNRAAFMAHPEVYEPQFGGYDPVAIARGRAVAGHPLFWAIAEARLYLFYTAESRDAFLADPGATLALAESKWPEVMRVIALER
jgi:hypothetical protein